MLEEGTIDWTRDWKQAGIEEERERTRAVVERLLVKRFGPLPASARERLRRMDSTEQLAELIYQISEAPSLAALGLS